jgi:hypothetical protein
MMSNLFWFDDRSPTWRKLRRLGEFWRRENPSHARVWFGRCRSGRRWFWAIADIELLVSDETPAYGWTDTEEEALAAARAAGLRMSAARPVYASRIDGFAKETLGALNARKRASRPPPEANGSGRVEYLYGCSRGRPVRFRITKKTPKRIFYLRAAEVLFTSGEPDPSPNFAPDDSRTGLVNRQKIEADGEIYNRARHWCRPDWHLWLSFQPEWRRDRRPIAPADLHSLKMQMAAAHPDRGGSSAEFIAARERYVAAKQAGAQQ